MRVLSFSWLLLLGGCAGFGDDLAKGCSGPARPANPNGSVLIAVQPAPTPPAPQAARTTRSECR